MFRGQYQYSEQQVDAGGLRITTTVSGALQSYAVGAVNEVMEGEPDNLREALRRSTRRRVASSPTTAANSATSLDYAQGKRKAGSSRSR